MKKRLCTVVSITLLCGIFLEGVFQKEDFKIYNSIKNSYSNYESVTLQVIVNKWNYEPEEMIERVKNIYCKYEMVNEITINLYDCVKDLKNGKTKMTKVYLND